MIEVHQLLDIPVVDRTTIARGKRQLLIDLHLPQNTGGPIPLIVYIHGGGWKQGVQYRPPGQPRLYDKGIGIAATTYRFSGEAPFPACLHDCQLMLRWLVAHADQYNLDTERMILWGISAGGHLCPLLASTLEHAGLAEANCDEPWADSPVPWGEVPFPKILGIIDECGPTDLCRTYSDPTTGDTMIEIQEQLLGGPWPDNKVNAELASPMTHIRPDLPEHLITHGADDPIVPLWHAEAYHKALLQAGVKSTLEVYPGVGHSIPDEAKKAGVRAFCERLLLG